MTRKLLLAATVCLSLCPIAIAQEDPPKFALSNRRLTADEVAIFRAVLKVYLKGSRGTMLLANATVPADQSSTSVRTCSDEISARPDARSINVVHRIDPSVVAGLHVKLADPDAQEREIEANDPQNLIHGAIDEGQRITTRQLDDSVTKAFSSALFTFSEIVFDQRHVNAVVSYSFHCGSLCGNGNALILRKVGEQWKISKRCGGWIS
jgi:hypothetical protein